MIKKNKKIFLLLGGLFLGVCILLMKNYKGDSAKVEITKFENNLPDTFKSSYYIDVYNDNSDDRLKEASTILISEKDKPIYVEFVQTGSSVDVLMNIYIDFKKVDFRVEDLEYQKDYTFSAVDGYKFKIPVYFNEETNLEDGKKHKMLVTFTSAPEQHIAQYDRTTHFYGINGIYDISTNLNAEYSLDIEELNDFGTVPENNFNESYSCLVLNTDYENQAYWTTKNILNPKPCIEAERESKLKLMYNIEKKNCSGVMLLVTIGNDPVYINGDPFKYIQLDEGDGTANGTIEISVPNEPGMYEVIAYAIYNPFNRITTDIKLAESSERFTLLVK